MLAHNCFLTTMCTTGLFLNSESMQRSSSGQVVSIYIFKAMVLQIVETILISNQQVTRWRNRGGKQWVFKSEDVALNAIWVQPNAPPQSGEERGFVFAPLINCIANSRSWCLLDKIRSGCMNGMPHWNQSQLTTSSGWAALYQGEKFPTILSDLGV